MAKRFESAGIDCIEVSGGTSAERWRHVVTKGIKHEKDEAYFRSFAALFKKHLNVPVILVGGNFRNHIESLFFTLNSNGLSCQ